MHPSRSIALTTSSVESSATGGSAAVDLAFGGLRGSDGVLTRALQMLRWGL